jgi:hypothetical protein
MRLYVNGDSHAAAAEAVNTFAFAEDDSQYFYMGRVPHPANAAVSWATRLSQATKCTLHMAAEAASSNRRIMRTTQDWINKHAGYRRETVLIIQWTTWEREEWLLDGTYYQITASGTDDVPAAYQDQYREYIVSVDWHQCTKRWHDEIWQFHEALKSQGWRHVFFNGNSDFAQIPETQRQIWGHNYIAPYQNEGTYDAWLKSHGHTTVFPESWHFGSDAHADWAKFMLQYIVDNKLLG